MLAWVFPKFMGSTFQVNACGSFFGLSWGLAAGSKSWTELEPRPGWLFFRDLEGTLCENRNFGGAVFDKPINHLWGHPKLHPFQPRGPFPRARRARFVLEVRMVPILRLVNREAEGKRTPVLLSLGVRGPDLHGLDSAFVM